MSKTQFEKMCILCLGVSGFNSRAATDGLQSVSEDLLVLFIFIYTFDKFISERQLYFVYVYVQPGK